MSTTRKELSEFQRGEIIGAWKCRELGKKPISVRKIGELLGHPKSTVQDVITAYKNGCETPAPRSGRPPILNDRDGRHLKKVLNTNRRTNINEICENSICCIYKWFFSTNSSINSKFMEIPFKSTF